jgi:uncharacterized protein
MPTLQEKYFTLLEFIKLHAADGAAVAFSGGVDSSLLSYAVHDALGDNSAAITVASPMLAERELQGAKDCAAFCGIRHIIIRDNIIEDEVAANSPLRCYYCKKNEFGLIKDAAAKLGIATVFDGSNIDDASDYRPGLKALEELGIKSPLREAGLNKDDIRALSRQFGLPTAEKPAAACLASRIPYGEKIDAAALARVEAAEIILADKGFKNVRVRSHSIKGVSGEKQLARIEAAPEERQKFFDAALLDELSQKFKALGFVYVTLELEGYRTGSLNRMLEK